MLILAKTTLAIMLGFILSLIFGFMIIPILKKSEINYRIGKSMIKGSTV